MNLPISHWLKTPVDVPRLLWQLPWVLSRTQRKCYYCINQVAVFQRQSSILGNMPSQPRHEGGCFSFVPNLLYLLKGQLLGFVAGLGISAL